MKIADLKQTCREQEEKLKDHETRISRREDDKKPPHRRTGRPRNKLQGGLTPKGILTPFSRSLPAYGMSTTPLS